MRHGVMAPSVGSPDARSYGSAGIARGKNLFAPGYLAECHACPGGPAFADGRAMHTRVGTIHATDVTPDAGIGVGRWSQAAIREVRAEGRR